MGPAAAVVRVLGLGLLLLARAGTRARPLALLNHKDIVMTLHGLMDHIPIGDFKLRSHEATLAALRSYREKHGGRMLLGREEDVAALFQAMDTSGDGRLFIPELASWLLTTVCNHFDVTAARDAKEFRRIARGRAVLSWPDLEPHLRSYESREDMAKAFVDADENGDRRLAPNEFAVLRSPEKSLAVRRRFADRFLRDCDVDGDAMVNSTEFLRRKHVQSGPGSDPYSAQAFDFRAEEEQWLQEFNTDIDMNGDGLLDHAELVLLFEPRHFTHAVSEAYALVAAADLNGDHEVSPHEMQETVQLFRDSRMLDFGFRTQEDMHVMYEKMASRLRGLATRRRDEL